MDFNTNGLRPQRVTGPEIIVFVTLPLLLATAFHMAGRTTAPKSAPHPQHTIQKTDSVKATYPDTLHAR